MTSLPGFLPTSRVPDPADAPPLRWGVLGTGLIAGLFVDALAAHTRQQVVAVGSRDADRAGAFAARYGIGRAHPSYAALLDDTDVDIVYVASPHSEHSAHASAAIAAGKHVLVEKAFTRSADEARALVEQARAADVFVMEAMWTRFLPHIDVVRQLLADGVLGEVSTVLADHGQYFADLDPAHRLLNPRLAGGALLDLGIYPISFAAFALGLPDRVHAVGTLTDTGVDAEVAVTSWHGTAVSVVDTTLRAETPTTASISGSVARVEISGPFYTPAQLTVTGVRNADVLSRPADPIAGHRGLCFQAAEAARCITAGRRESPLLPADESVAIMAVLDDVRRQVGVVYPGEERQ